MEQNPCETRGTSPSLTRLTCSPCPRRRRRMQTEVYCDCKICPTAEGPVRSSCSKSCTTVSSDKNGDMTRRRYRTQKVPASVRTFRGPAGLALLHCSFIFMQFISTDRKISTTTKSSPVMMGGLRTRPYRCNNQQGCHRIRHHQRTTSAQGSEIPL